MTGYLGVLGNMFPIIPASSTSIASPDRFIFQEARTRRWAFVSTPPGKELRTWEVNTDLLSTSEAGLLEELRSGVWGLGPFIFIPCEAHDTNILTPAQSVLTGVGSAGSLVTASRERVKAAVGLNGTTSVFTNAPVIPGLPLTLSLDVAGASTSLELRFLTSGNALVGSKQYVKESALAERVSFGVLSVPSGAAKAELSVAGAVAIARPQLTWTAQRMPWSAGRGASQVVIQNAKTQALGPGWFRGDVKIVEVG